MTFLDLEIPAIKNYKGAVCSDSDANWDLDSLIAELNHIEDKLRDASPYPSELKLGSLSTIATPPPVSTVPTKKPEHIPDGSETEADAAVQKSFVMRVPYDVDDESDYQSEEEREQSPPMELVATGTRFSCADLYWSEYEDSDEASDLEDSQTNLMRKISLEEGILYELERENRSRVREEVRKSISRLEAELRGEYEKTVDVLLHIDKSAEARREMDKRLDKQYQRKIAEELDRHLSIVQRNHERRFQEEEIRIRNDAAREDAKRKEKALQEEKIQQEKAKAETEARLKAAKKAEEAKKAALDAANKASKEAVEAESVRTNSVINIVNEGGTELTEETVAFTKNSEMSHEAGSNGKKNVDSTGVRIKAADSAIKAEAHRLEKYNELAAQSASLSTDFKKEHGACDRHINKRIRQITGTVENVRAKAYELVSIISDPRCPHPISMMMFARKVVSICDNPSGSFEGTAFACGHVVLLVVSQVPALIDYIIAEFNKVCIYTVPKYIQALEPAARTKDYWKMVGYREENGKLETSENYLQRIESYMKLYAAIIQTETSSVQNPLGLKEGWAWMARFLNELPATASTGTALHSFLKMAGFALHCKYKVQFKKILNVISNTFLPSLRAQQNQSLASVISKLELYITKREFLNEPEGWRLRTHLSSREFV